jgi:FolB domain-containing protein
MVVRGLHLRAHVGVAEEERATAQGIVVDVTVTTDLARAGASDDLADTIDYAGLLSGIAKVVEEREANLLEALAERIVRKVEETKTATGVTVEVSKEIVPVEENVDQVSVRIERQFS